MRIPFYPTQANRRLEWTLEASPNYEQQLGVQQDFATAAGCGLMA